MIMKSIILSFALLFATLIGNSQVKIYFDKVEVFDANNKKVNSTTYNRDDGYIVIQKHYVNIVKDKLFVTMEIKEGFTEDKNIKITTEEDFVIMVNYYKMDKLFLYDSGNDLLYIFWITDFEEFN